jgi:Rps23 Pro-64 3,4-dihydroxylase Tpa1-like proline 4-hydroxylase|tara:strand:+ start:99 stop:764 length:666 start_codon:yes stop_codon:yes gene_type:complete
MFDHLLKYREEFSQTGQVIIKNLLPENQVEQIYQDYLNNNEFKVAFWTGEEIEGEGTPIQYADKNTERYNILTKQVYELEGNNTFSYRFSRTNWIQPLLYELWSSKIFSSYIEFITGQENLRWVKDSSFTSKYEAGDFLYTHTDINHGRIAFVYQLTKDWLPGYGGLFMRMDDWVNVDHTIIPQFNQLTLFDVQGEGTPHIVTNVIPGLKKSRMAYSGWLA